MAAILLTCYPSSEMLILGYEFGIVGRGHPISERHASKIDGRRAMVILSIQTGCQALKPLAPRSETSDGNDRDQEGLGAELSQRPEGWPSGMGIALGHLAATDALEHAQAVPQGHCPLASL
jgi:hypothetical protein